MAGILQELLQAKEPLFSVALRQLEVASGHESRDTRLIADIAALMRMGMVRLGLDPDDTTGPELYAAQMVRVGEDNRRLAKILGGNSSDDVAQMTPLVVKAVRELPIPRKCWVLKRSVAKKIVKAMPPKNLMKHLGYRSLDSMLKHENIDELYAALRFSEGQEWLEAFNTQFSALTPSDFETREIAIVVIDHDKYLGIAERFCEKMSHPVVHSKELGVIAVLPTEAGHAQGITLKLLLLLLHYINEIRLYSAFFKLKQVLPNFGEIMARTLNDDPADSIEIAGQHIHWRVVQRYYGDIATQARHPQAFEPHIQPDDLRWHRIEEALVQLDPALALWRGLEYTGGVYDNHLLTFNLMDLARAYANNDSYELFQAHHFQNSLWNELYVRYMGSARLQHQVITQLDTGVIAPEQ